MCVIHKKNKVDAIVFQVYYWSLSKSSKRELFNMMIINNEKSNSNEIIIGVLGGMGTYATIHVFEQYAKIFEAKKEWERPRIVIDNRCTMPSRVLAYLYGEKRDQLILEMTESLNNLYKMGCSTIILACNTSHLFLEEIYKTCPYLKAKILNIIDNTTDYIKSKEIKKVWLLASEGTIDSKIYQEILSKNKIECLVPSQADYELLRICIEAVKQNIIDDEVKKIFIGLLQRGDNCILGCTELPILYSYCKDELENINIFDPVYLALQKVKDNKIEGER